MFETKIKKHVPLPKKTPAFICANCGAVSLDSHGICRPQGKGTKADWCGTKDAKPANLCFNRVNNIRYKCGNCGQVSVNKELLCEPEQMALPDKIKK